MPFLSEKFNAKLKRLFSFFSEIKPYNFFLTTAFLFQVSYNLVTPPLQAPDELNHFYRAYRIAEGSFLPQKHDQRLGGEIPKSFYEFIVPYTYASTSFDYKIDKSIIFDSFKYKISNEAEFKDFPNTSYYSAVSYIPQVVAIFILKKMDCSIATIYYGGRFFVFIVWVLCMFFAIKIIPVYKWLFTLLILLPMNVYITNSFSADTVTCILSFLFIAFILKLTFADLDIRKKDILIILLLVGLLALAKVVYIGLVVLLFLIPKQKFGSSSLKAMALLGISLFAGVIAWYWSGVVMQNYLSYSDYNIDHREISSLTKEANYYAQKNYILTHGSYFFKVVYHSLVDHPQTYLLSYIGCFGTYLDIPLPLLVCVIAFGVIIFTALFEANKFTFTFFQKISLFASAFVTLLLLLLSQHLTWDAVGKGVVDLLQGRYLIPILPLVFVLLSNDRFKRKYKMKALVMLTVVTLNSFSVNAIYNRFIYDEHIDEVVFYCDAETINKDGNYATSNQYVVLDANNSQTTAEHKSGTHSICLSPASPYGLNYKFKDVSPGDIIEIAAWRKGVSGDVAVSGKGLACGDMYFASGSATAEYNDGWTKMSCVFTIPQNCGIPEMTFFIWNTSKEKIYFDDIKFVWKKFKRN